MPEKNQVYKEELKHDGFWKFSDVYNFCFEWLKSEGYNVKEEKYTEKLGAAGKEIIIDWKATKKISDYYRNNIELKWHILRMNDAEVEVDGKKLKTNKGEVKIAFEGLIEKDYEAVWETKPVYKLLRSLYDKYIMKTTFDEYETRLQNKVMSFVEETKAFLVLEGRR